MRIKMEYGKSNLEFSKLMNRKVIWMGENWNLKQHIEHWTRELEILYSYAALWTYDMDMDRDMWIQKYKKVIFQEINLNTNLRLAPSIKIERMEVFLHQILLNSTSRAPTEEGKWKNDKQSGIWWWCWCVLREHMHM